MKIVITGGHFSPAYALIQEMKKDHEIVVVGRKYAFEGDTTESLEYTICKKENIPFSHLSTGRLQRNLSKHTIPSILRIPQGITRSISILKKERPDIVVTFGGYVAVPIVLAAKSLHIPVILHEQTLQIGVANKIAAKFSDIICVSYEESLKFFPKERTILTGLPIRKEVFEIHDKFLLPKNKKVIYVTGGSTGAHAINEFVKNNLSWLLNEYAVIHQTGDSNEFQDFEKMTELKKKMTPDHASSYIVKKYISPNEIGWVYSVSDIVVSRAGANTVAELLAISKKAILIPLPGGQSNEQKMNAAFLEKKGNTVVMDQSNLSKERFSSALKKVEALSLKKNTRDLQAVENLVQVITGLYEKKKHQEKS